MRFLNKKRVLALLVLSIYLLSPVASWACTSTMVGKNASTTGRVLFSRSEDASPIGSKKFIVVPAGFFKANTEYELQANGFKFTFTHDSYKYTAVPYTTRQGLSGIGNETTSKDRLPHWEDGFYFTFDGDGVNEKGFAVSATTSTGIRSGINMTSGTALWTEHTMAKVLLAEAANCQEAMDVVDKILASGQGMTAEIIHMADQNEGWLLEAIGRHHYVASRVPDDCVAVLANAMHTQYYDENDPANYRSNLKPGPNTYAEQNGFARYQIDENGVKRVNISLTYAPTGLSGVNGEANTYRRWRGMTLWAPSLGSSLKVLNDADYYGGNGTNAGSSDIGVTYPAFIKPDRKISPMDITNFQRDRYAGTPFDQTYAPQYLDANGGEIREGTANPNTIVTALPPGSPIPSATPAGAAAIRTVGYYTAMHTHVYDVGSSLPPEIGARFWIGMAAGEHSVSLPFYGNITDTHPKHKFNVTEPLPAGSNLVPPYDPNSACSTFAHLGYLARGDRKNYGAPIKDFWRAYELKLYDDQEKVIEPEVIRLYKEVSPAASAKFATDYTIAVSDRAFRAAEKIHDALVAHMAAAPNTLFQIPAELLEPAINDSAFITPTDEDKKAVEGARGAGNSLLTRDDGNVQVTAVGAGAAPSVDGYNFNMPGASINIALKPEQVAAKQTAAKMLYEVKLDNAQINAFGNLDSLKKNLAFVMDINGKALKIVGPDTNVLTSFTNALANGIATLTLTSDGAIVTVEYILVDGPGNSGVYNNVLVVSDGTADDALVSSIWLAVPDITPDDTGGCDAGIGFAVVGLFAMLMFELRKKH
ncbi:MAG: C69 family dipeptidase [Oscillospiraceae bacterium]|nr:C69 family dipeptidase [Oscillospiraceae bacterium]